MGRVRVRVRVRVRAQVPSLGGLWRAGGWLRRGWGHCPRCGGAPWPMAVAGVAVWRCGWREGGRRVKG